MIKAKLGDTDITYISYSHRLVDANVFRKDTPIRLLPDGSGWILIHPEWMAAKFFVKDPLQKLDLNNKPT